MTSLEHEADWWANCANTWMEEFKQQSYTRHLGFSEFGSWPWFDLGGRSVVDMGGGPVSLLLKCVNGNILTVVDPCVFPDWVAERYSSCGIDFVREPAEQWQGEGYDEAWIYNVLQHVESPQLVIENAMSCAKRVRIFEWTNIPACAFHPHELLPDLLDEWTGIDGMRLRGVNSEWGESKLAASWAAVFDTTKRGHRALV